MLPAGVIKITVFLLLATFLILPATPSAVIKHHFSEDSSEDCVYTVYVETGCNRKGGTDSNISLAFSNEASDNGAVKIPNLEKWGGLMGGNHKYFERDHLDVFSGRGPCLSGPPCWIELSSDGSGTSHGWYCNYVEVTATGPHKNCTKQFFTVEQWLALDRVPYQLTATRDYCSGGGRAATKKVEDTDDASVE